MDSSNRGPRWWASLRGRILVFVLVAVVLPLLAVGLWLTGSAARAGRALLASQLEARLAAAAEGARQRWTNHRSDVRLLAENEPVRLAMLARADTMPGYLRDAFAGMTGISRVTFTSADSVVRWTLGNAPILNPAVDPSASGSSSPALALRVEIPGDGQSLGSVDARIVTAGLLGDEAAPGPAQAFLALHHRDADAWIGTNLPPLSLLHDTDFDWNHRHWLTARVALDDPAVTLVAGAPLDLVVAPFQRTARIGAIALAIVITGVVLMAIVGSRRLTASLSELGTAADAVAGGDLDRNLPASEPDEVGRVARAFNSMTESLRRMMRERSQREAVSAVGELAATVAHQIRSPLTAMKLNLQRAEESLEARGAAEGPLLNLALAEMARVERAVGASLRIARTGSGQFALLDLRVVIAETVAGATARADARGIQIDGCNETKPIELLGDAPALVQMLGNVVANAVDAARTQVQIAVRNGGTDVVLEVRDDGPGIPADVLPRVGEPFFSTKPTGTGLGLAIAQRVAAAHRGAITIESSQGSTIVSIRLAARHQAS